MAPILPTGSQVDKLDLLPDREWLFAKIDTVEYTQSVFMGLPQFVTNMEGEEILDKNGNKIPKMIFNITFLLRDYSLSTGQPRKAWLNRVGATLNPTGKLFTLLTNMGIEIVPNMTEKDVIDALSGKEVKIQLSNKKSKQGRIFQNVVFDAVKAI